MRDIKEIIIEDFENRGLKSSKDYQTEMKLIENMDNLIKNLDKDLQKNFYEIEKQFINLETLRQYELLDFTIDYIKDLLKRFFF